MILLLFSYLMLQSADAQAGEPLISAVQQGNKTILLLPGNWTSDASRVQLVLSSEGAIGKATASSGWTASVEEGRAVFSSPGTTNSSSIFVVYSNATSPEFEYTLSIDSAEHSGTISPLNNSDSDWYSNWTDSREGAMSAFIPSGWKADLQIIRPYNSMTGFVFYVRGEGNALAYIFYPFMPLHIVPEEDICKNLGTCDGMAPRE